jgi:hypothetical protein
MPVLTFWHKKGDDISAIPRKTVILSDYSSNRVFAKSTYP